jgi:Ca-activated chloride channel family protein
MTTLHFANPELLWLLLLLPILAFWLGRRGKKAAIEFSSASIARQVARETRSRIGGWMPFLRLLALGFLIAGLARPQLGHGTTEVETSGIDMVLAIDVSGSMQALDFTLNGQPADRLDVVKSVVSKFIESRPNDRIGIVAFGGAPYLVSPLTLDHDWLQQNLDRVQLGMVEDGTAIGSAIATSVNRLRGQASKSKIIVLLTDGMNNAGKVQPLIAAEAAKALGIKIYCVGAGTEGSAPFPMTNAFGQRVIQMMKVDIDEETLQKIAEETGGAYFRATDTNSLKNIYSEIDRLEKTTHSIKKFSSYEELFAWALLPALFFLGAEFTLAGTWYRRLP